MEVEEADKTKSEKQNKFLINQLGKTISENSKVLAEIGIDNLYLLK